MVIGKGSNGSIMDLGTDVMVVKSERGKNGSIVLEYVCQTVNLYMSHDIIINNNK